MKATHNSSPRTAPLYTRLAGTLLLLLLVLQQLPTGYAANGEPSGVVSTFVDIPTATDYSQNLDSIGTTAAAPLPTDLRLDRPTTVRTVGTYAAATTVTTQVGGVNLSPTAINGAYNFGSGTTTTGPDRAIGLPTS